MVDAVPRPCTSVSGALARGSPSRRGKSGYHRPRCPSSVRPSDPVGPAPTKAKPAARVNRERASCAAKSGLFLQSASGSFPQVRRPADDRPRPGARPGGQYIQSDMRSTKIVATIGPSSRQPGVLERMITAGVDVARLNFAHGEPPEHAETAAEVRAAAERVHREVAILGDVPGPKLRIGPVAGGVTELGRGNRVVLTPERVEGNEQRLPVAWTGLAELVHAGDVCYVADGTVRLRVDGVADGEVVTHVEVGGVVASRQGINLPNVTMSLPAVSEDDIALIDEGLDMGVDLFALSFVRRREDLEPVRDHLRSRGSDA